MASALPNGARSQHGLRIGVALAGLAVVGCFVTANALIQSPVSAQVDVVDMVDNTGQVQR